MAPGIEPGNLIRSTLIRYPPGPFFVKLSNKVTGVTEQNAVENKVVYHYILYYMFGYATPARLLLCSCYVFVRLNHHKISEKLNIFTSILDYSLLTILRYT